MTGDRSLLAGRISSLCEDKLVLQLAETGRLRAGRAAARGTCPTTYRPGAAFRAGSGVETQVALLAPDASGAGPGRRAAGDRRRGRRRGTPRCRRARRPFRVDVLPARMSFADAWALRDPAVASSPALGPGRRGRRRRWPRSAPTWPTGCRRSSSPARPSPAAARCCWPWPGRCWPPGTGLVVAAPRPSPLRSLDGRPGVAAVFTGSDLTAEELTTALSRLAGPAVVMIDDAEGATRLRRE